MGVLARALLDVETAISDSSFSGQWSGQRALWRQKVGNFGGGTGDESTGAEEGGDVPGGGSGAFGSLLLDLDGSMIPTAMESSWSGRRGKWQSDVRGAGDNVSSLRTLMMTFETNVKYEAQESYWSGRRADWVRRSQAARDMGELRNLLGEMESSIKYSAQAESWRETRPGWLRRLQGN